MSTPAQRGEPAGPPIREDGWYAAQRRRFERSGSETPARSAHRPVPRAVRDDDPAAGAGAALGARVERLERGVVVTLPVRAEQVVVERRTVVREEVAARVERRVVHRQVEAEVRREQVRVGVEGDIEVTQRIGPNRGR